MQSNYINCVVWLKSYCLPLIILLKLDSVPSECLRRVVNTTQRRSGNLPLWCRGGCCFPPPNETWWVWMLGSWRLLSGRTSLADAASLRINVRLVWWRIAAGRKPSLLPSSPPCLLCPCATALDLILLKSRQIMGPSAPVVIERGRLWGVWGGGPPPEKHIDKGGCSPQISQEKTGGHGPCATPGDR